METDTETIERQLLEGLSEVKLDYCGRLLVSSLAIITARIQGNPDSALPSLIAQQRQLIRAVNALKGPGFRFFS